MNLDETIKYYVEKAEDCEAIVAQWKEKATEYRQLAEQLTELKNRREVSEIEKRRLKNAISVQIFLIVRFIIRG